VAFWTGGLWLPHSSTARHRHGVSVRGGCRLFGASSCISARIRRLGADWRGRAEIAGCLVWDGLVRRAPGIRPGAGRSNPAARAGPDTQG